jgi:cobalt-zinc-cadmium efflux system outer membrane protein
MVATEQHWDQARRWVVLAAVATAVAAAAPAVALAQDDHRHVEGEVHTHEPVAIDPGLEWSTVIDAALAAYPARGELAARSAEVEAWERRGRQWLAAAPALYFSYLSDRPRDDWGQKQYDTGVELPLWRPGQRSAVQAVAASASVESDAAVAARRLEVAGLLRGALWDIAAANNTVAAARDAAAVATELVRVVERRNARGDLPRADTLLARAVLLEREQAVVAAEAELADAERAYRSLTGLDVRPASFAETPAPGDELTSSHPLVALAEAGVVRAEASLDLAERDVRGPLTLAVGPHREVDPFTTIPRDSLIVELRLPVGGKSYGATETASAARAVASAESAHGQLLRRLDLDLHEAEHALGVLERSAALAAERDLLATEQLRMAQAAFAQGEIELRELLRVQDATLAAHREVERLATERQRTVAALNQALGVTP